VELGYFAQLPSQPAQTWAPPAWNMPQPTPPAWVPPPPPVHESESRRGVAEALLITLVGLTASFSLDLINGWLPFRGVVDRQIRTGLIVTLSFYVVLGLLLAGYVKVRRVRLVWVRGTTSGALALGLPVGVTLGLALVGISSLASGRLSSDSSIQLLVGGGGVLRLSLTFVTMAALAPLVEETLFRGVTAASLLAKGPAVALLGSAGAFAVWHMNLSALRYYSVAGLLLGGIWLKRGLLASMAAHAAFNGVLTVAAIAATGGAGHATQVGGVWFVLPGGWHGVAQSVGVYEGPAAAAMMVTRTTPTPLPTVDQLYAHLQERETSGEPNRRVQPRSEQVVDVDGTSAVAADIVVSGEPGHLLAFVDGDAIYTFVMITSGSPNAERDWQSVIRSVHASHTQ
jgi:membrane protease YdiL (CAAX protease family)